MNRVEIHNQENFDIQDNHIIEIVDDSLCIFDQIDCFVELNFVSKSKIAELNRTFRQIDKPTDVLSFPQAEVKNGGIKVLGDIVISPEIVAEKDEKMDDVIKHGLLHLLGYDHEIDESVWQKAADKISCQY
ncbi:rRNA maturation RNase YbeY [Candidatus Berkelbacteria bacterium CG10_big_fil_rev_8_21_14_0_10_43_13]|uniref:Endoribonuclease YbeY n=1 Tax=Candidatus Berkelbacteria bacterium CG10_big_fil_rev_8_21_14_0_10_43_13 TaxID=1974514 RepID=A0A2H0W8E5_9BACT|nr:MAG: rRNA maturation RNase YbeY [Candidatus Berkelbacteria bacterium CG10_big_fil_rev_8_21_14_0_10_43_13]